MCRLTVIQLEGSSTFDMRTQKYSSENPNLCKLGILLVLRVGLNSVGKIVHNNQPKLNKLIYPRSYLLIGVLPYCILAKNSTSNYEYQTSNFQHCLFNPIEPRPAGEILALKKCLNVRQKLGT